jgi:hypothetical protein
MHVGDEFFLSSIMPLPDARDFAVTFDDWGYTQRQGRAIRGEIAALARLPLSRARSARIAELWRIFDAVNGRPKTITKVDAEDLRQMRATDAYFYRKFARGTDVEMYLGAFF